MKQLFTPQLREKLGVILLVLFSLFAIFNSLNYVNAFELLSKKESFMSLATTRYEHYWDCVRDEIEPGSEVGFVTPPDPNEDEYYLLTQYTFAPTLLSSSDQHPLVLGYVPNPGDLDIVLSQHPNLHIIKECDNGVVLFRGK